VVFEANPFVHSTWLFTTLYPVIAFQGKLVSSEKFYNQKGMHGNNTDVTK